METVDAAIVFLPRFTTLVGSVNSATNFDFATLPLDVSRYSGVQFQIWRSPMSSGSFAFFLEESLDAQTWVLGPAVPTAVSLVSDDTKFCSYNFRLRWFRLRVRLTGGASPIVSCWAEGLLRSGGSGVWPVAGAMPGGAAGVGVAGGVPGRISATAAGVVEPVRPVRPPMGPQPGEYGEYRLDQAGPWQDLAGRPPVRDVQDPSTRSGFR
jgi:hypothetical protein